MSNFFICVLGLVEKITKYRKKTRRNSNPKNRSILNRQFPLPTRKNHKLKICLNPEDNQESRQASSELLTLSKYQHSFRSFKEQRRQSDTNQDAITEIGPYYPKNIENINYDYERKCNDGQCVQRLNMNLGFFPHIICVLC